MLVFIHFVCSFLICKCVSLSLSLSLSHTNTHTHTQANTYGEERRERVNTRSMRRTDTSKWDRKANRWNDRVWKCLTPVKRTLLLNLQIFLWEQIIFKEIFFHQIQCVFFSLSFLPSRLNELIFSSNNQVLLYRRGQDLLTVIQLYLTPLDKLHDFHL